MNIVKKIVRKIVYWFFKDDIDNLLKSIELNKSICDKNSKSISNINSVIGKNSDFAVDVHEHGGSWMVVSLHGKKRNYVKFIDCADDNIMEIAKFLNQFARENNINIDANPFTKSCMINEEMFY
jgi:hypothetical protein